MPYGRHTERHRSQRSGWLRAAVLGANDGIVSTASLLVGVAAAGAGQASLLATGVAALVAGAMSMAAGEYVSVHSQADAEKSDLAREQAEIERAPAAEHQELTAIYEGRGVESGLAKQVAEQLMKHDALGAHARDELGLSTTTKARPVQAAWTSALSFAVGAALPLATAALAPVQGLAWWVSSMSLLFLAGLGSAAARVGGAGALVGAGRVVLWGAAAMALTAMVGNWFGAVV